MLSVSKVTPEGAPYSLDKQQTSKAVRALLKHIRTEQQAQQKNSTKRSLLAQTARGDDSEEDDNGDDMPLWLLFTTKKHIIDKAKLKPNKVVIPHPLQSSPHSSICLITVDPQRAFKDVVAHVSFPESLRSRINRVIGISKLRAKYKQYENRRQLYNEHEIFLADDRVIKMLPQMLGKIFYHSTIKRPIPVCLTGGKQAQLATPKGEKSVASPKALANEINRTLSTAQVHLSPSTCTSVRVGSSSWKEENIVENVEAVVQAVVEKFVPRKWKGLKSIHIKGSDTAALPLWFTDELWIHERDVLNTKDPSKVDNSTVTHEAIENTKEPKKKRKVREGEDDGTENTAKKQKKTSAKVDQQAEQEAARRKEKLRKQKAEAVAEAEQAGTLTKGVAKEPSAVAVS